MPKKKPILAKVEVGDKLVPAKPAPWRPVGKPFVPPEGKAQTVPPKTSLEIVRDNHKHIFERYVAGDSLDDIGSKLQPQAVTGLQIRVAMHGDPDLKARWTAINEHRAHHLIEVAVESARNTRDTGNLIKLAEKILPRVYGAKATIALGDAGDGPSRTSRRWTPPRPTSAWWASGEGEPQPARGLRLEAPGLHQGLGAARRPHPAHA
jgi:hypothetical protein